MKTSTVLNVHSKMLIIDRIKEDHSKDSSERKKKKRRRLNTELREKEGDMRKKKYERLFFKIYFKNFF